MRHAMLLVALLITAVASAVTLSTPDGLALDVSDQGRITAVRLGQTPLPVKGQGGFSVCDHAIKPEIVNLVPNGGFEAGAQGWTLGKGQSLDTAVAHSGRVSAKLVVEGPTPGKSNLEVYVPVKPNTQYIAELWVRRDNVGVCGAYISERDATRKVTGPVTQMGASIPKQDNVWLPLQWKFTTQPNTTQVSFRSDIYNSTGTLWLDDFILAEAPQGKYEPLTGKFEGLRFDGQMRKAGLRVQAKFVGWNNSLRVDGVLEDTTGRDRAIGVRFSLPVDLAGWTWWDDAGDRSEIKPATTSRNTYQCVSGIGACSIYPWSAVSPPETGGQGLSLALPLSQGPRVFIIQHDQAAAELSITFFFGLSKLAGNNPSRAPFSFVIYPHEGRWGMRSAMERYYPLFPESFVKRPDFEGYLNYANLERCEPSDHTLRISKSTLPDYNDFGEGYKFLYHVHGCYDYRQIPWPSAKMMTDEEVMAELQKMVAAEDDQGRGYVPTLETIKKICRGPEGQILYISDTRYWRAQEGYNHTDQPGWGLNFRVNEDPAVSNRLQEVSRQKARDHAKTNRLPWDATFTADAIEGYMSNSRALDYNPEHLKTALPPLTFGKETLRPATVNTIWEFLHNAWWPISQEYQVVTYGNANHYEQAFTLPYVDIPMTEGTWDPRRPARLDRYLRGMAHHKIWRYWHAWDAGGGYGDADPNAVRQHMARGLAHGIYPSVYCVEVMGGNLENYRALFRQHIPALEELNYAGWEPVPYARAGDLSVERFGSFTDGELHFTLRNWGSEPAEVTLQLDRTGLGIPPQAPLLYLDVLPGTVAFRPVPSTGLPVKLAAGETLALWVGTLAQAAQHGFRLAGRVLEKIGRTYHTELDDASRKAWLQTLVLAQLQGQKAEGQQAMILAQSLQNALTNLPLSIKTKSPVDLTKLIYRAKVYASMAPAVISGASLSAPRVVENAARGAAAEVPVQLTGAPAARLQVLSPWPDMASRSALQPAAARLHVAAEPQRHLLPYLLVATGAANGVDYELCTPVDVVPGTPVSLSVQPLRAFRGQQRQLVFTVRNALKEPAQVQIKFAAPAKTTLDPAEITLDLPANGAVQQAVTMSLEPLAFLGNARIGYTVTSAKPQFNTTGNLGITISDPVPQLGVKPTAVPPVIDGKLTEAVWQQPPLADELKLLADASPATEKTAVWMTYDKSGVYVAMRCAESQMDKLMTRYTQRGDPLYLDDDVELFVFPVGAPRVYQFAINALGTQSDNSGNTSDWKAAAQRGEAEWTVEAFIPYGAVGVTEPPAAGLPWGMQFGRQQKAKRETTSWTPGSSFISKEGLGEIIFE